MSPRRPDISYEEAAAVAGVDPNLDSLFDDLSVKKTVNDEVKKHLGRRVMLIIEREDDNFDVGMSQTVVDALVRYAAGVINGNFGNTSNESFRFQRNTPSGVAIEPVALRVIAESYELEKVHVVQNQ